MDTVTGDVPAHGSSQTTVFTTCPQEDFHTPANQSRVEGGRGALKTQELKLALLVSTPEELLHKEKFKSYNLISYLINK